jgi:hypothetical protein
MAQGIGAGLAAFIAWASGKPATLWAGVRGSGRAYPNRSGFVPPSNLSDNDHEKPE